MADGSGAASARYRAFISYSHRDAVFAGRLHRRLEGYVLPKRLGAERRLTPIFKDREELPAAHDLSAQVRAALAVSECLVVVCSPDAAASPWVGREIELFRELHPDRPILAALVRGEPAEAFPAALVAGGVEPLAADFRKDRDGERLALLKLVGGVAGIGIDQLIRRDTQRRLRGVMAVTALALAALVVMGLTTAFALEARAEAERQRAEAEGLVEFMLTDLRQGLKSSGTPLRVLSAVNRRALAYYVGRDLRGLPPSSLQRRAELMHAMGEDDLSRAEYVAAQGQFREAHRVTARLLSQDPVNPSRVKAHAQSEYWLGRVAFDQRQAVSARGAWTEYARLSRQLVKSWPERPDYVRELGFAEGNLCSLAVELDDDGKAAIRQCRLALSLMQQASMSRPSDVSWALDVANRWAWLADAYVLAGDLSTARQQRLNQESLLSGLIARAPDNVPVRENWIGCQRGMARIAWRIGDRHDAVTRARMARDGLTVLTRQDPEVADWKEQLVHAQRGLDLMQQKSTQGVGQ